MSIGFLSNATDAIVWRGPMASSALKQFISDADWGELEITTVFGNNGRSEKQEEE